MMWKVYAGAVTGNGLSIQPRPESYFNFLYIQKTPSAIRPAFRVRAARMRAERGRSVAVATAKGSSQIDTWWTVGLPSVVVVGLRATSASG